MKIVNFYIVLILLTIGYIACDSGPRVIEAENTASGVSENSLPVFNEIQQGNKATPSKSNSIAADDHEVQVEEVLNTEKYSYLKVDEGGEKFWIAISKTDIEVGERYVFKEGLLKRNFYSREFDRVFETVYLVSKIRPLQAQATAVATSAKVSTPESLPDLEVGTIELAAGAVSLADIFSNREKYAGQKVKITGKCVKVNPMIMNRNWLHLQDGSGKGLDLTVTTTETVPLGAVVSLEGTIAVDRDFGAGYRYDIIMEGATLN